MADPRLIIFARFPAPGHAKTRLIPALGDAGAARLQDTLTRHTLGNASALAGRRRVEVEVRFTGSSADAMRARYGGGFAYADQGEGDLGVRLARAASEAGTSDRPVVVIGTDCPGLTADALDAAFDALGERDVVLGPALDGGYYLVGFRRFHPGLFAGIPWSTSVVLSLTRQAASAAGLTVAMLPPLGDVDVPDDLAAYPDLRSAQPAPYYPAHLAVTGATGAVGQRFLARLLREVADVWVTALVRAASRPSWPDPFRRLIEEHGRRVVLVDADLESLRLSGDQGRAVVEADGGLWHFAASTALHAASPAAEASMAAVNDGGTARLLDLLAASDRPGPLYHVSTAYVCGRRSGTVHEHELDDAAGFRNLYERSKHAAEARVRAALAGGLAGLIFRPGFIASGSATPGPADVVTALAAGLRAAASNGRKLTLRMPPGAGVNAAPADWLARVLPALAPHAAARRTYHLTAVRDTTIADVAAAAARVDSLDVRLIPGADAGALSPAERLVDRMLRPFRPYFDADVRFDRRNLELDAPELASGSELDVETVLRQRLQ